MRRFLAINRALGDETRVRALMALKHGELCLCQLIELFGLAPSTVSKHMSVLIEAGLVELRKEGRWHFYRIAHRGASAEVRGALAWALSALQDDPAVQSDFEKVLGLREKDLGELSACYRN